jgi:H+/Cl- antiporter ClcA
MLIYVFIIYYVSVGAIIGLNAALIDIITEWLSDIKTGYCKNSWWLNQKFCCWEIQGEGELIISLFRFFNY